MSTPFTSLPSEFTPLSDTASAIVVDLGKAGFCIAGHRDPSATALAIVVCSDATTAERAFSILKRHGQPCKVEQANEIEIIRARAEAVADLLTDELRHALTHDMVMSWGPMHN